MSEPITYTVMAADGQHYGPYPADNVQAWINEGRIKADQQMTRSDLKEWFRAGDFSEFVWTSAPVPPPAPAAPPVSVPTETTSTAVPGGGSRGRRNLEPTSGMQSAASWFYWIAGLSAVNFILALSGAGFSFAVGSGAVDFCAALARGIGGFNPVYALVGVLVIVLWVLLGVQGGRGSLAAFIVGVIMFALDTLLVLAAGNFIGIAVHAYILFRLGMGLKEAWMLRKMMRE